jgi:hypothetical protein
MMRPGFTLMEALVASVVLAMSVAAIATVMAASHQQDRSSTARARAIALATQTLESLAALPLDNVGHTVGLSAYDGYADLVTLDDATARCFVSDVRSQEATPPPAPSASLDAVAAELAERRPLAASGASIRFERSVRVTRSATLNGAPAANGKLARIAVDVVLPDGSVVTLQRLVADIR